MADPEPLSWEELQEWYATQAEQMHSEDRKCLQEMLENVRGRPTTPASTAGIQPWWLAYQEKITTESHESQRMETPKKKSERLAKLCAEAVEQLGEQEYQRMIASAKPSPSVWSFSSVGREQSLNPLFKPLPNGLHEGRLANEVSEPSMGEMMRDVNRQLVTIVNVLFSMAAVFYALYYYGPHMTQEVGHQILIALAGALVVGIAEVYLIYVRVLMPESQRVSSPPKQKMNQRMKAKEE